MLEFSCQIKGQSGASILWGNDAHCVIEISGGGMLEILYLYPRTRKREGEGMERKRRGANWRGNGCVMAVGGWTTLGPVATVA